MHKILVVDDEIDLLEVIRIFLQRKKFLVEAISRWENIKNSIVTFSPDLILLDISLKGADGRVICKQLKRNKETENIPVLLFSANYGVKETISEFQADGFIEKPFDLSKLISEIESIIERYKGIKS